MEGVPKLYGMHTDLRCLWKVHGRSMEEGTQIQDELHAGLANRNGWNDGPGNMGCMSKVTNTLALLL